MITCVIIVTTLHVIICIILEKNNACRANAHVGVYV